MKFITHALTYRLYTRFTFLFTFVRDFDRSDWLFSIDVYWHQLFDTYNWIIRHLRNGICIFIEYTKWTILKFNKQMGTLIWYLRVCILKYKLGSIHHKKFAPLWWLFRNVINIYCQVLRIAVSRDVFPKLNAIWLKKGESFFKI